MSDLPAAPGEAQTKLCIRCKWNSAHIGRSDDPVPCGRYPDETKRGARERCGGLEWEMHPRYGRLYPPTQPAEF